MSFQHLCPKAAGDGETSKETCQETSCSFCLTAACSRAFSRFEPRIPPFCAIRRGMKGTSPLKRQENQPLNRKTMLNHRLARIYWRPPRNSEPKPRIPEVPLAELFRGSVVSKAPKGRTSSTSGTGRKRESTEKSNPKEGFQKYDRGRSLSRLLARAADSMRRAQASKF